MNTHKIFLACLIWLSAQALSADNKTFPLFVQMQGVGGFVFEAKEIGATMWLLSSEGVYYAYKNQYEALPLVPRDKEADRKIFCIESAGEDVLLGANDGLFQVVGAEYERSPIAPFDAFSRFFDVRIESMAQDKESDVLWIATSHGLFSLNSGQRRAEFVPLPNLKIDRDEVSNSFGKIATGQFGGADAKVFVRDFGDQLASAAVARLVLIGVDDLIIVANDHVVRRTAGALSQFAFARPGLLDIKVIAERGYVYILGYHPRTLAGTLYRLSDKLTVLVDSGVLDISGMDDEVWVAKSEIEAGTNIYTVDRNGGLRPISVHLEGAPGRVEIISETSQFQVLLSSEAILLRGMQDRDFSLSARKRNKRIQIDDPAFEFVDLVESNSGLWLFGSSGAYRSVDDTIIDTRLRARETFFLRRSKVAIDEVFYDRSGVDPFPEVFSREFWALLHFERNSFSKSKFWPSEFVEASDASVIIAGESDVLVAVSDSFGNLSFAKKKAPGATTNYITKVVSGVLKVVFAGALTVFFTTLLAALATKLLLWNIARKPGDPYRRLSAYISLERWMARFSIYRVFLQPKWGEMKTVLRQIYVQVNCAQPPVFVNASTRSSLDALGDAENSYHEEVQSVDRIDLFEMQRAIAHSAIGVFVDKLPVVVRLKNFVGELTGEHVRGEVINSLKNALPGSDEKFCGDLLVRMTFVFLFSAPSRPSDVTRSIEAFFDAANRDRNLVFVIIVPIPGNRDDDLTEISGIGPMIAEILNHAGINSFDDLADASVNDLHAILGGAGARYRSHNPVTWPQQARLAACGRSGEYPEDGEVDVDEGGAK